MNNKSTRYFHLQQCFVYTHNSIIFYSVLFAYLDQFFFLITEGLCKALVVHTGEQMGGRTEKRLLL